MSSDRSTDLTRRKLLLDIGALGAGTIGLGATLAGSAAAAEDPRNRVLGAMCVQTPTIYSGPFYLNQSLVRRNVTEGQPGLPLNVFFKVVRAADCQPIPNVVVDLWQANAAGVYSGIPSHGTAGQKFLRGIQTTDMGGWVMFETIFPGWFPSRTTHIHLRVRHQGRELTTQTFFEDSIPDLVYRYVAPYTLRGVRDTNNAKDFGYRVESEMITIANPNGSFSLWSGLLIGLA